MKSETHLPVGLAKEAAVEIDKLRAEIEELKTRLGVWERKP
jgi:hypothetical protein